MIFFIYQKSYLWEDFLATASSIKLVKIFFPRSKKKILVAREGILAAEKKCFVTI